MPYLHLKMRHGFLFRCKDTVAVFLDIILCLPGTGYGTVVVNSVRCSFPDSGLSIALLVKLVPVRDGVDTSMGRTRLLSWLWRYYMKFNIDISNSVAVW